VTTACPWIRGSRRTDYRILHTIHPNVNPITWLSQEIHTYLRRRSAEMSVGGGRLAGGIVTLAMTLKALINSTQSAEGVSRISTAGGSALPE
jgi:hypothetical protein